ncbi:hypothetical protein HMN09_00190800 [Mycena chlorophos]|uniref:Uncharacterized protein n=1 Tax=Mycena chlorophos TaxID=658473 RepID=A0A8H6TPM1_MYCCL|nr:hypothetical protein HMN09_00190800 [Mycena chlorophos]
MIIPPAKSEEISAQAEAPPAYEPSSSSSRVPPVEKPLPSPGAASPTSLVPSSSVIRSRVVQKTAWAQFGDDMGLFMADMGMGSAKTAKFREVQKTVTGLIHDLVRNQTIDSNAACAGILDSCSEACAQNGINMPTLLQQPYIEGHTPLYWAIVKRPADPSETDNGGTELPPLVLALLAYSAPLKQETVTDIRLACLHTCDQWLFQCLRNHPDYPALPHKDQLLLGVLVPPDTVRLDVPMRHDAPFTVTFAFADFQKRLRVTHEVRLDFISHSRIWELAFADYTSGSWGISAGQWAARLTLSDKSPQARIAGALITIEPQTDTEDNKPLVLEMSGQLYVGNQLNAALPDTFLYQHNPFLAADGTLRGKLTIQLKV